MKRTLIRHSASCFAALCGAAITSEVAAKPPTITLETLSSVRTAPRNNGATSPVLSPPGASIILTYDSARQRLLVVNQVNSRIEVIDISDPASPVAHTPLDMSSYGPVTTSVAVHGDLVAVAVTGRAAITDPGAVVFFDAALQHLATIPVGPLPDMITFTPNGRYLLASNEGEPSNGLYPAGVIDPEGSISLIDIEHDWTTTTIGFAGFNSQAVSLRVQGVHLNGPNATVAQDLEPEWITVSQDSKTAWVTLQENNAVAVIDIPSASVTKIAGLGTKDHSLAANSFDGGDRDGGKIQDPKLPNDPTKKIDNGKINIRQWPVQGLYQPDSIESIKIGGTEYLVIANEGAGRDVETARVKDLGLDPEKFSNFPELKKDTQLGRLNVSKTSGDIDGDGDLDVLNSFGGRSFSILSASGQMLWDSGSQFETTLASLHPGNVIFNASNTNNIFDDRSDDKGPEPEGVALGKAFGRSYAFIGLERIGGIMVYDISTPESPQFVEYVNNRDFTEPVALPKAGDLGPEGMVFISGDDSPNGSPLLVVANEVSGTTSLFKLVKVK